MKQGIYNTFLFKSFSRFSTYKMEYIVCIFKMLKKYQQSSIIKN